MHWGYECAFVSIVLLLIFIVIPIIFGLTGNIPPATQFEQYHDQVLQTETETPRIHVVSYASGRFKSFIPLRTKQLKQIFGNTPYTLKIYGLADIDPAFVKTHQATFDTLDGGGLWLWKPWIVHNYIHNVADENDVVIYVDIGRDMSRLHLHELVQRVYQSASGMLAFSEIDWVKPLSIKCKGAHIREAGIPVDFVNDKQSIAACFFMLKVQNNVKQIMTEWLRICSIPGMLTYEQHLEHDNPRGFRPSEFRHDQSILAPMLWWHKAVVIQNGLLDFKNENPFSLYRFKRYYREGTSALRSSYNKLIHNDYCYSTSTRSTKHGTSFDGKTATNESNNSPV